MEILNTPRFIKIIKTYGDKMNLSAAGYNISEVEQFSAYTLQKHPKLKDTRRKVYDFLYECNVLHKNYIDDKESKAHLIDKIIIHEFYISLKLWRY